MYSGMAKGTSQAEVMLNITLAIIELCEAEGIRQASS